MNGRIDWAELFFSASGRAARGASVAAAATLIGLAALYEAIVGPTLHWLTGWFVYPALIYCGACVLSKRLHDRGPSGCGRRWSCSPSWPSGPTPAAFSTSWP